MEESLQTKTIRRRHCSEEERERERELFTYLVPVNKIKKKKGLVKNEKEGGGGDE